MKEKKIFKKAPALKALKRYSTYVYLGAAVITVAVTAVSIYSVSRTDEVSVPSVSVPSVQLPERDDTPVINTPEDVPADIETVPEYRLPVEGSVLKDYSMDTLVFSHTMQDYRTHCGVDISAEKGAVVFCYADGSITQVYADAFYGTVVEISHSDGISTRYANLDPEVAEGISEGAQVKAGQPIGTVGNTAIIESADESHLHFEVMEQGEYTDPIPFLEKAK